MMGLLDGQKAVTAQESAATQTGGGTRSVSLDAKDEAVYTGQTKPGMDDESQTTGDSNDNSEAGQSDLDIVKDLMEKIREYMVDMSDPYMKEEIFAEKYNNGDTFNVWTNELKELVGEDYYNEFISIYNDWEMPEKIDTPEDIIAEQNNYSNPSDNNSNVFDDIIGAVSNVGKWVYDSVTGGIKWVQDNADAIREAQEAKREAEEAEKKELMDSLEGDYAQIAPALESMIDILDEENGEVKDKIEALFEDMLDGEEFSTLVPILQATVQNTTFGNDIYVTDYNHDDIRSEMEVLTCGTVNIYNTGETLDDIVMDFLELFLPSGESSLSDDLVMYTLEQMVDGLKELNDPGKILQDGDIRISTQNLLQSGENKYTHYFFRGTELRYSINTLSGEIEYGENYDMMLAEVLQNSLNQLSE
jgi:hypothetical protein